MPISVAVHSVSLNLKTEFHDSYHRMLGVESECRILESVLMPQPKKWGVNQGQGWFLFDGYPPTLHPNITLTRITFMHECMIPLRCFPEWHVYSLTRVPKQQRHHLKWSIVVLTPSSNPPFLFGGTPAPNDWGLPPIALLQSLHNRHVIDVGRQLHSLLLQSEQQIIHQCRVSPKNAGDSQCAYAYMIYSCFIMSHHVSLCFICCPNLNPVEQHSSQSTQLYFLL